MDIQKLNVAMNAIIADSFKRIRGMKENKLETPYTDFIVKKLHDIIEKEELTLDSPGLLSTEFQAGFRQVKEQILVKIKGAKL